LLIVATLLLILRKRDLEGILFISVGVYILLSIVSSSQEWNLIILGGVLLLTLLTLFSKDLKKWLFFLIPGILFIDGIIDVFHGTIDVIASEYSLFVVVIALYYAFCYACERCNLPLSEILKADEKTDFKQSGSIIIYLLFTTLLGGYVFHYILGEAVLPLESFIQVQFVAAFVFIYMALLLLIIGGRILVPIMFFLVAVLGIISMYCSGTMFIGIGILVLVLGLISLLKKEGGILFGIMLIVYSISWFFTALASDGVATTPALSIMLNLIPCIITLYLGFIEFSQLRLPKL